MNAAPYLDFVSHSATQTSRLGERLGALLQPGDMVLLEGTLGTGKTVFAQGIARGLGIDDLVTSPTFTLIREYYGGRVPLYHVDLYRLSETDVPGLGLEDYLFGGGVTVVEWANRAPMLQRCEHLHVTLKMITESKRGLRMQSYGARYETLVASYKRLVFGL